MELEEGKRLGGLAVGAFPVEPSLRGLILDLYPCWLWEQVAGQKNWDLERREVGAGDLLRFDTQRDIWWIDGRDIGAACERDKRLYDARYRLRFLTEEADRMEEEKRRYLNDK